MAVNTKGAVSGSLILALASLTACTSKPSMTETARPTVPAFDVAGMDTTAKPCDDFDRFANGLWKEKNPVPSTESRWGAFGILAKENLEVKIKGIIDTLLVHEAATKGSTAQLVGDFYRSYMDTAKLEELAAAPLKPWMDRIDALKDLKEQAALSGEYARLGVSTFVGLHADADMHDSKVNILYSGQDGLSLGERSYYEKTDSAMANIRTEFVGHVDKMFSLAGLAEKNAGASILAFETGLAKLQLTNIQRRDPDIYQKISFTEFAQLAPKYDLALLAKSMGIATDTLLLEDRAYVEKASAYIAATPLATLKTWMKWQLLGTYANVLNKALNEENFRFEGTVMSGTKEQKSRQLRALRATDGLLGEPLGKLYAENYFPASSRKKVEDMIENVRTVYGEHIKALTWMSPGTKTKALEKLALFTTKIGYPGQWKDYSMVDIQPDALLRNTMNLIAWRSNDNLKRIGKPVDTKEWGMTPQTVNAYYNPSLNEVVFPAGILQPPFFNADADDAINYGGIIAVIGHELTHGFDDQGAKFDGHGNLVNWWTDADKANFDSLAQRMIAYYDGLEVLPGIHVKGALTVGENIADLGGVTLAYAALQRSLVGQPEPAKVDGYTWQQRFFLGWAQVWRSNATPEAARRLVELDPHSPAHFRINAIMGQFKPFQEAWCTEGKGAMLVPDSARVVIW
ncbi:MAG: M13 family metallopeptidase [Flavobacteriales bacterium]|nr:M13 family metallopeptidase [Flavobacteriales bacterium]MBP9080848.1 M13 family metallopeptidase [Flavobacteriales bacterium]